MKKAIIFILMINFVLFFASGEDFSNSASIYGSFNNIQEYPSFSTFTNPTDIGDFWPILKDMQEGKCEAATDFVVLIPPGGCTPQVVRSDLLAEQNVPVFCKLVAIQINPLIKVSSIRSISFRGSYPKEVAGIRFYPARAGASTFYRSLNNNPLEGPVASEIGYAAIILKKTPNESSMTKWINGTATANLVYDAEQTFGLGKSEFFLGVLSDKEWETESGLNSFWNGRMFLRLLDVEEDKAKIALYVDNKERPYRVLTLEEGEISDLIYLPGFYCMAGIKAKLNSIEGVEDSAILQVGDEVISVRENSRILNGRCSVREISINSNEIGYVRMNCGRKDFYLILSSAYKPNIEIDGSSQTFEVGGIVLQGEGKNNSWYVAYSTINSNSRISGEKRVFVVLVSESKNKNLDTGKIKRIRDALRQADVIGFEYNSKDEFIKNIEKHSGLRNGSGFVLLFKEDLINLNGKNIKLNDVVLSDGVSSLEEKSIDGGLKENINTYFGENEKALKELYQLYPRVKDESGTKYSERAYLERIAMKEKLVNLGIKTLPELNSLREEFLQRFPDSKSATKIRDDIENSGVYDRKNSTALVEVNGKLIPITLLRFSKTNPEDKKAEIYIDNIKYYVTENLQANLTLKGRANKEDYFVVERITKDYVQIKIFIEDSNSNREKTHRILERRFPLEREQRFSIDEGSYNVKVTNIDIEKSAHISLIPEERNIRSEANFTFKIGIEKRLFELNPEKADKRLEKLNKTIKEWEEKRDRLGRVIESWKKACFFTGIGLNVKNLIEGFSGKAIARKEVMQIYREMCVNDDRYKSGNKEVARAKCYSEMSSLIEQDVNAYTEAIKKSNEELKKYKTIDEWRNANQDVVVSNINNKEIKGKDLTTWTQVKNYLIKKNLPSSGSSSYLTEGIDRKLNDSIAGIAKLKIEEDKQRELNNQLQKYITVKPESLSNFKVHSTQEVQRFTSTGLKSDYLTQNGNVGNGKKIELINTRKNGTLLVVLTPAFEGKTTPEFKVDLNEVYKEGTSGRWEKINIDNDGDLKAELSSLRFIDGENCKNKYKEPRARYFTSSYAKGMPAIVPFDEKEGWYVRVSQSQGELFSSEAKGYTEAGLPRFFYICNVGPNGREENLGGDDICQSFDVNNYDRVGRFGGCSELSSSEVLRLAEDAQEAIRQAASQYNDVKNGVKEILIKTKRGVVKAKVGEDFFSDRPGQECYDFMSPTDCNILFNVCDPVVCPPSRCDFGGKAPVDNVVASGIAGSLLLCLPNFGNPTKGGVIVPICLTGVHAGIDAYLSILRAQYSCIEQAKKTGKYVGVCDYFTAVYTCEFFWKNAQPFLRSIVPRVFEFINDPTSIGKPRGGGEYLTFQKSWDIMEESMSYFKNQYAKTSFRVFQYSDVGEFGSEFCRSFIGTSFPTKGKALDQLFKPESPTQFYAEFSEIPFTEATVPPTSQYKVLYHIYAGNDLSVSYRVYLKDPPASAISHGYPQILVGAGAIQRGKYASESKDFTAPSGYKQLCVEINGKESCGFKQVTSDVGLDYLTKMQAREEAQKTGIETESQCVSGSSSIMGLTSSLNIQEGTQSAIKPELYRMGIVRVCATENPGKGTAEESKWKIVGYCGNTNIKCWLSEESINQNTISLLGMAGTVKKAEEIIKNPNMLQTAMTEEESRAILTQIKKMISELSVEGKENKNSINNKIKPITDNISKVEKEGAFDFLQAEAHYLKTLLYLRIVDLLTNFDSVKIEAPALTTSEIKQEEAKREEVSDDRNRKLSEFNKNNEIKYKGDIYKVTNMVGNEIFLHKIIGGKLSSGAPKKCLTTQTVGECLE